MHLWGIRRLLLAVATTATTTALVTAGTLPVLAPSASAADPRVTPEGAPVVPGGVALTWVPAYMADTHAYTRAEATGLATRHDLVAAMPLAFQDHADAMRQANPRLGLLAYANATLANAEETAGLPEAAYAHDAAGRRISVPAFGTRLMESSNRAWRQTAAAQCDDRALRGGYDGCLVDMLTLGIFSKNFVTALPVDPATGEEYTQLAYRRQMIDLAAYYRAQSPELAHVGNSVENAYRYWQSPIATSRPLVASQPAAQMEDFLRGAGSGVAAYPAAADWVRHVDVVRDMEASGAVGLFTTKLWVDASDAQVARWQSYAMASFLMGADGDSYLSFSTSRDKAGVLGRDLPYAMPSTLGTPAGAMTQQPSGAWVRTFGGGAAVVNPTGSTVTVPLGRAMRTLDGRTVTSLTLGPSSGDVLLRATAPAAPAPADDDPTVTLTSARASGGTASWAGRVEDDVEVSAVRFAIRDEDTGRWRRPDGTWGAYAELYADLAARDVAATAWSKSLNLAPGRYGVSVTGVDTAGNRSATSPWSVVTVAG